MAIVRAGDLDIDVDLPFQRRSWVVQRVGWALMTALVLAAFAGLLGPGPLSKSRASIPGVLEAEYERFTRYDDPEILTIRVAPGAAVGNIARVSLSREYLHQTKIESVLPPPERVESAGDRVVFAFRVADPAAPVEVTFHMRSQHIGRTEAALRLESGPRAGRETTLRQLVYP